MFFIVCKSPKEFFFQFKAQKTICCLLHDSMSMFKLGKQAGIKKLPKYLYEIQIDMNINKKIYVSKNTLYQRYLFRCKTFGQRTLSFQESEQWNALPIHLKNCNTTFKK